MVDSISVRIALEGGDEIEKQLADIGQAGQKAFADIQKSADQVGGFQKLDPTVVTQKLNDMGLAGTAAFGKIQDAVQKAANLEKLVQGIQAAETAMKALGIASLVTLGGIAVAIVALIPATIRWAESLQEATVQATKLGLTVTQFDQLRKSMEAAGVSAKAADEAMKKIGEAVDKAQIEGVTQAFNELTDSTKHIGIFGSQQLGILQEAAKGVGKAADLARADLAKLQDQIKPGVGAPTLQLLPSDLPQKLDALIVKFGSTTQGIQAFIEQLAAMPAGTQSAQFALDQLGEAGLVLFQQLQRGAITADQFKAAVANLISPQQAEQASQLTAAINQVSAAWKNFSTGGANADLIIAGLNLIRDALNGINSDIAILKQTWDDFASSAVGSTIITALQDIGGTLDWLNERIRDAAIRLRQLFGLSGPQGPTQSGEPLGAAHGGLIGGIGTGTSDSNLIWVSRGEHIMPARAVAQPGVLAFLEALRSSGGNLSRVLDGMGRFALGGLVPRTMPAFAAGGLVGGMSSVTIQFPGVPPITGLRASSATVDELRRTAALAQVRSGGRKPSRYS